MRRQRGLICIAAPSRASLGRLLAWENHDDRGAMGKMRGGERPGINHQQTPQIQDRMVALILNILIHNITDVGVYGVIMRSIK